MTRAAVLAVAFALAAGTAAAAAPPGWETAYDFAVQDVCVDRSDHILPDVTPLDDPAKCPEHRNLKPGEPLPYHKDDWAGAGQAAARPDGLQSNDTFPIATRAFGTAVVQLRSFIDSDGHPLPYQPRRGGGGVYLFSERTLASGITEDPNGLQFFFGPECGSADPAQRILDAWVVVDKSFAPDRPGHMVARLSRVPARCERLTYAYTSWKTRPVDFRIRSGGVVSHKRLETLVSDHFGGESADDAPNMERFYFTRELGLVRWERWQNFDRQKRPQDQQWADDMASSGQCDSIQEPPAARGHWVMVRCRQYTNLVKSADPAGELARSWLTKLKTSAEVHDLFGE